MSNSVTQLGGSSVEFESREVIAPDPHVEFDTHSPNLPERIGSQFEDKVLQVLSEPGAIKTSEDFRRVFAVPEYALLSPSQRVIGQSLENILCGRFPSSPEEVQFAERFTRIFFSPAPEHSLDAQKAEALEPLRDKRLSESLRRYLDTSLGSPVQTEKSKFGITGPENEKPYDVCVVSIDSGDRKSVWDTVSEGSKMFVLNSIFQNGVKQEPTIYMSAPQARSILYGASMDEILALRHEYRHTQRSSLHDAQGKLFQFVDEAMTSIEYQYVFTRVLLRFLAFTTPNLKREDFLLAHETDDDQMKAECLKKWVDGFGPMGLLLLGASHNAEFSESIVGDFGTLPISKNINNQRISYVEKLLSHREKMDPDWQGVFMKNLQSSPFSVDELRFLSDSILNACFEGLEEGMAPHISDMLRILNEEISRREAEVSH